MLRKRNLIEKVEKIKEPLKKKLYVIGFLTEELKSNRVKPIIVGGCALEFYTTGGYSTGDIDIVFPDSNAIDKILSGWDFIREGRHWISEALDMYIELPGSYLKGDDLNKITKVNVGNVCVYLIGVEDLIIDRLNAAVHWKSKDDRFWAKELVIIHKEEIDLDYLSEKADKEGLTREFKKIRKETGI